jgi:hypothetical protein
MAKLAYEYVVEVEPKKGSTQIRNRRDEAQLKRDAEEQMKQVVRHVDYVQQVYPRYTYMCEFCKYPWEEPPACCDHAMDEYEKDHPGCYDEIDA